MYLERKKVEGNKDKRNDYIEFGGIYRKFG